VNIILHSTFPQDAAATVDLRGLTFQRILDTLMIQNDLFYRVVDSNTILVLKDGQQQRDKFENQLVKTFYLSNAEAENVRGVLQMLVPQIKTFVDKRLNALVMRGNPQQITTATRVVNQLDKAKAEVMVYMELMEVTQNSLEQVGLLPVLGAADTQGVYRLGATLDNTGAPNQNKGGIRIQRSDIRYLFPSLALDALKSSGDAKLVASPNVRVLSGVKGEVNIGEQVSTTQSSIGVPGMTGTTGVSAGMASSYLAGASQTQYAYQDVGVKINVTPSVHFNGDISLKIEAEIKTLKSGSTPGRPDMGQRIIKTEARAKDGETIVFAGMLKEDERKSLQGIWGLSDIPLLGKLIGSNRYERAKTDVLLTFRAVVVRKPDLQFEDLSAFDPDFATSQSGPFAPKASTKMETPKNVGTPKAEPAKETPKGEAKSLDPKPGAEATKPPAGEGVPTEMKTDAKSEAKTEPQAEPAQGQLVLFLAPIAAPLAKGQQVELNLLVSNGRGLSSGNLELRIDPKLKLVSAAAGDFLTQESGSIQQAPLKDGILKLAFTRSGTASDSGSLVTLILEGLAPGNAPVLVQSGSYMVGKNPIAALVHNALITVE
ncbi:MAG: hypothetical protein LWX11_00895, partial [Firmicutes bacterium]|nr:hypothetical protein [Bacillota bacterium]